MDSSWLQFLGFGGSTRQASFTLLELMVTITIAAALIVAALFFYFSVIPWAQSTVDKHTYMSSLMTLGTRLA